MTRSSLEICLWGSSRRSSEGLSSSLLFSSHTLLFIKSQYTVFSFFVHLIVFCTSCCFFAHLFCTSYCLLHILLFFAHLIVLHFFYFIAHLFLLFLPYVCPCVMLLYIICILIILHCPLSGPDSITFHF